jgi:hypothetical protein
LKPGTQNLRSSWLGIGSFIIWLLSSIFVCTLFITAFLPYMTNSSSPVSLQLQSTLFSILWAGSCLLTPLALILGMIGVFQKNSGKTFAVISTLGAGLTLLCILLPLITWAVLPILV